MIHPKSLVVPFFAVAFVSISACSSNKSQEPTTAQTAVGTVNLPAPNTDHDADKQSDVIGWKNGRTPKAPVGFTVTKFADGLKHPRNIYVAPNHDIFVAESDDEKKSANQITVFRDADQDGTPEGRAVFLSDLKQPYGMTIVQDHFYVANTDGIMRYPYKPGQTKMTGPGKKILELPAGGYNHHWTRNLLAHPNGSKIYISVGSASNVGEYGMEEEQRRANILEINPDGTGERVYASGLRNPVGTAWAPGTNTLYTAVNERDKLGDDLVPDYLTSVQEGAFYGWPYSYFGNNVDPRMAGKRPDLVEKALVPDVSLGAHTASLGLAFYDGTAFPAKYHQGAFIGQHGSWNRSEFAGYKVVFVPFKDGKPAGEPEDFLTGFIADGEDSEVYGRPVGIAFLRDGSMLVADDASNTIWRIAASSPKE